MIEDFHWISKMVLVACRSFSSLVKIHVNIHIRIYAHIYGWATKKRFHSYLRHKKSTTKSLKMLFLYFALPFFPTTTTTFDECFLIFRLIFSRSFVKKWREKKYHPMKNEWHALREHDIVKKLSVTWIEQEKPHNFKIYVSLAYGWLLCIRQIFCSL